MNHITIEHEYYCPRCKTADIIEYHDRIECRLCHSEFLKQHFARVDDEDILSVQEILSFISVFEEMFMSIRFTQIKDILTP